MNGYRGRLDGSLVGGDSIADFYAIRYVPRRLTKFLKRDPLARRYRYAHPAPAAMHLYYIDYYPRIGTGNVEQETPPPQGNWNR
ncbi:MAG: hypothetical protein AB7O62_25585 [Pirellulales bacterium]